MQKIRLKYSGTHWLMINPTLYSVDSETIPRLHYAAKGDKFMVIRDRDMYLMDLHEAEEWIRRCKDPEMAEEMREVVEDVIAYDRGCRNYERRKAREKKAFNSWEGGHPIRTVSLGALNTRGEWM